MVADCLHDLAALGSGGLAALMGALFLAGLAGSVTHCAAMCGPFVMAQVAAGGAGTWGGDGVLRRLSGAALLPYHAGRMIGYGMLGALAGGSAGLLGRMGGLAPLLAALLGLAALFMLAQASQRMAALLPRLIPWRLPAPTLPAVLQRHMGALLAAPQGWRGVVLGLLLSALPCGLLYGALAAAAASGSALGGALVMVAFVAGTMPALLGVALFGRLFGRRHGPAWQVAAAMLFTLNAVVLGGMAVRLLA
jgi:sulfite exporter TauE/SafE